MKITFIKDFIGPASGNSFYGVGDQADLPRAAELIELGVAREGWGPIAAASNGSDPAGPEPSYRDLQKAAKAAGIRANQPRAALERALESA